MLRETFIQARAAKGWTQQELADQVGENVDWIRNREQGKSKISLADAARLANALRMSRKLWVRLRDIAADAA